MRRFFKLVSITIQSRMYYRATFLLRMVTPLLVLFGQFVLWLSLFGGPEQQKMIGPFGRADMISYLLAAFFIGSLLNWQSEGALARDIQTGMVIAKRLRPVSFLAQSLSDMVGNMAVQSVINALVVLGFFAVFRGQMTMSRASAIPLFLCSLCVSMALRMLLAHCFQLLCFFTTSHLGIAWTRSALTDFFSGALIPVALFPAWLGTVAYALPFPLMLQPPMAILFGWPMPVSIPHTFLLQAFWIGALLGIHGLLYGHIRKNSTLAGG